MLTTIILLYKIKLPKIQLCLNIQLNLHLMRQFLFAQYVRGKKSRNLTAEKPAQFFEEFGKFHYFVFTQKSVGALISFQLATPQCALVLKKKGSRGIFLSCVEMEKQYLVLRQLIMSC